MMNTIKQRLLFLIVVAASYAAIGWCQANLGGITGRVTDPTGAAIPEAAVVLTSLDSGTAYTAGTSGDGLYAFSGVTPGRYRINVTKTGFQTFSQQPIIISTATIITLDIGLTVGTVAETVNVTAQVAALETTSAEVGTVMPQQQMLDLPLYVGGSAAIGATGRRQLEDFTYLTPGVQGNQWSTSVNGAPGMSQDVLVDGYSLVQMGDQGFIASDTPPYEAVAEFKMENTLYPANVGGAIGVEQFTLRSGTSKYHGDVYDFMRNSALDSRGFFPSFVAQMHQNEYGATFGGPVYIPKLFHRDGKTFFFFTYTGFKLRGGLPPAGLDTIPTPQELKGDFSDYPYPIFDPVCDRGTANEHRCSSTETRQQFSYEGKLNVIPPSLLSGVAQRTNALVPPPDIPGAYHNNYYDRSSAPANENDEEFKIDRTLTDKQHLSGSFWMTRAYTDIHGGLPLPLDPQWRVTPNKSYDVRINYTDTISPTLINHAGAAFSRTIPGWSTRVLDPRLGNQVIQIPGIPPDAHGYPYFDFTDNGGYYSYGNTGNCCQFPTVMFRYDLGDDLTWVKGKHEVKLGALWYIRKYETATLLGEAGMFDFDSNSTSQPNDPAHFSLWGNSYASFELGEAYSGNRAIPAPTRFFTDQQWALYAQDSIKVMPKLTFTAGIRYEIPVYATERNGNLAELNLTEPNPGAGGLPGTLMFLGTGTGRSGTKNMFGSYYGGIEPRLGLAYQLNSKTVLRLGYGIFRLPPNYGLLNQGSWWATGFGSFPSFTTTDLGVTPAFNMDVGFPTTNITLPNTSPTQLNNGPIYIINPDAYKMSLTNSWSVSIQRELPYNILLDAAYVGNHSTNLWSSNENLDQVNPKWLNLGPELNAPVTCLSNGSCPNSIAAGVKVPYAGFPTYFSIAQALRPYPQYTNIYDVWQPDASAGYNALQLRVQKRFSNGLSFLGSYTLSKNLGDTGVDTFFAAGTGLTGLNTYNRHIEKTLVGFDQTHYIVLSWSYALPFGAGKKFLSSAKGVVNQLAGGWQLNSVETYDSATPLSISGGPALPIFNGVGNRPNWNPTAGNGRSSVSMGSFDPAVDKYLVLTPWSQPAAYTFGDGPPNQPNLRGPFQYQEDLSIFKNFKFNSEARYLQFRVEAFNVFNRVVFGGPNTNFNTPATFGIIGGQANRPRFIQFALKFAF